jgi:glycerophosphoryl diester phosphodiesterase
MPAPTKRIERIGHRGAPRERCENTLPSFLLALERGADAIELDVHVTGDGRVVVHHDDTLGGRPIAATPWAALRDVPLRDDARAPLLDEVLDSVGDRAAVYIEMKARAHEESVVAVARAHGRRFAIHSFDHACIGRIASAAPDVPRGLLFDRGTESPAHVMTRAVEATGARDVWPHWSLVDPAFMAAAAALQVRVLCWTVNSANDARRLVALGVDGVCTDDLRLLATV